MWDVVIIGAGVMGCAVARALSKYKINAVVLEKGSDVCAGASRGNSAMVHAGYDPEPGTNKAVYNVAGNAMFDKLCEDLETPFDRSGTMIFATNEKEMEEVKRLKKLGDLNKVPGVRIVTPPELYNLQPKIGRDVVGALWAPTGGIVCPYSLVIAMAENAAINGVEFRFAAEVTGLKAAKGGWRVVTGEHGYDTKLVINCAGTHSDELNNMVSDHKFTIIPRHGEHILMDRNYIKYVTTTICQTPSDLPGGGHTKGQGIMPSVDGTVILGCDAKSLNDRDDSRCTREGLDDIVGFFQRVWKYLPIGSDVTEFPLEGIIASYGGIRAHPDTDDFIIGEAPGAPGFFNAAGIESPGLTSAPAIAVRIEELVMEKLKAEKKDDYFPGRRAKKKFRVMTREERIMAIQEDPDYARIVCRCEQVTEAEIRDAIRRPLGARSISGIKMRTRSGMGRCQGGFCSPRVLRILCEELGLDPLEVTQSGGHSPVLLDRANSHRHVMER